MVVQPLASIEQVRVRIDAPLDEMVDDLENLRAHLLEVQAAVRLLSVGQSNHRLALDGRGDEFPDAILRDEVALRAIDEDGVGALNVTLEVANVLEICG